MTTGNTNRILLRPTARVARVSTGLASGQDKNTFRRCGWAACGMGAALLVSLTGCIGDMPHRGAWDAAPKPVRVRTASITTDEYVYYPRYAIYFNRTQHRYIRLESDGWSTRSEPAGVKMEVLLDSPSVPLAFHDAPGQHHDQVVRDYPKNWPLSGVAVVARPGY